MYYYYFKRIFHNLMYLSYRLLIHGMQVPGYGRKNINEIYIAINDMQRQYILLLLLLF